MKKEHKCKHSIHFKIQDKCYKRYKIEVKSEGYGRTKRKKRLITNVNYKKKKN